MRALYQPGAKPIFRGVVTPVMLGAICAPTARATLAWGAAPGVGRHGTRGLKARATLARGKAPGVSHGMRANGARYLAWGEAPVWVATEPAG